MIDLNERYKTTQKISGDLWKLYKDAIYEIDVTLKKDSMEQEKWWDETLKKFHDCIKPYMGTTHEYYANSYCITCMEDLNAVWKLRDMNKT